MNTKRQYERLYALLRRKAMTYLELALTGISTCPHKRLAEGEPHLIARGEKLVRAKNSDGRIVFRVVRAKATSWTA